MAAITAAPADRDCATHCLCGHGRRIQGRAYTSLEYVLLYATLAPPEPSHAIAPFSLLPRAAAQFAGTSRDTPRAAHGSSMTCSLAILTLATMEPYTLSAQLTGHEADVRSPEAETAVLTRRSARSPPTRRRMGAHCC